MGSGRNGVTIAVGRGAPPPTVFTCFVMSSAQLLPYTYSHCHFLLHRTVPWPLLLECGDCLWVWFPWSVCACSFLLIFKLISNLSPVFATFPGRAISVCTKWAIVTLTGRKRLGSLQIGGVVGAKPAATTSSSLGQMWSAAGNEQVHQRLQTSQMQRLAGPQVLHQDSAGTGLIHCAVADLLAGLSIREAFGRGVQAQPLTSCSQLYQGQTGCCWLWQWEQREPQSHHQERS